MKSPDKLLRIDGVAVTENCMYLYGRTIMEMTKLIGLHVKTDSQGHPLYNEEMYRIDREGIHVA
jgi:hypothetical protein